MKVLMYVDAENVTESQLKESLMKFNGFRESNEVRGKFYGDRNFMGPIFDLCISSGLEFIDTTVLSVKTKNLADMKIVVDVMDDCIELYKGQVSHVLLVSNDVDFLPLVYKLTSYGITVDSFLCNNANIAFSNKDITKLLHTAGFYPVKDEQYFKVIFMYIRELLDDNVPDDVLRTYVEDKYNKFISSMHVALDTDIILRLSEIRKEELCAREVLSKLSGFDEQTQVEILKVYFQQLFGSAPRKKLIIDFIRGRKYGFI